MPRFRRLLAAAEGPLLALVVAVAACVCVAQRDEALAKRAWMAGYQQAQADVGAAEHPARASLCYRRGYGAFDCYQMADGRVAPRTAP